MNGFILDLLRLDMSHIFWTNRRWFGLHFELDTLYLNAVINDKEFERPVLGNLLLIADCKSGQLVDQNMLSPKDDLIQNIFGIFINYSTFAH